VIHINHYLRGKTGYVSSPFNTVSPACPPSALFDRKEIVRKADIQRIPASQVGQGARYGPSSSFNTRTSVASSSINLRGSDRSPPAPSASDTNFYPGDPNDWSKEDDDHLHNYDPKDRRVSIPGRQAVKYGYN